MDCISIKGVSLADTVGEDQYISIDELAVRYNTL